MSSRMLGGMLDEILNEILSGMLNGFVLTFEITWQNIFGPIRSWLGINEFLGPQWPPNQSFNT